MLVPAISVKSELEKLFAEHLYDDKMFYYNCGDNTMPELAPKAGEYKWAIVNDKNNVVGYFCYNIDGADNVWVLGLVSFCCDSVIGVDVYRLIKNIIKQHRRIEWRMIDGNPVQRHYDRFCKKYNGNRVVLHNVIKNPNGGYANEYIYEIVNGGK